MSEKEMSARLDGIEQSIAELNKNLEFLFRLVGGRLKKHEEETNQRFRHYAGEIGRFSPIGQGHI